MLPVRKVLLLLIFASPLLSCNTNPKENRVSLAGTTRRSETSLPEKKITNDKQDLISKKNINRPGLRSKGSADKNHIINEKVGKPPQVFIISPERDTTITAQEGTVIRIKQGSFVHAGTNSAASGALTVHLTEYYKLSDILFADLSTESDGRILETGGMLFIEVTADGKQCVLKNDSTIEIEFPCTEMKEAMELFVGKWEKENVNWQQVENSTNADFVCFEEPAQFPGGQAAFIKFILNNITYPDSLLERGLSGRVSVRFEIDQLGKARFIEITELSQRPFLQMMQNLFLKMPLWSPSLRNGQPVTSRWIQPVIFLIEGETFDTTYKRDFETKMADETFLEAVGTTEISKYVFSSSKLGWINCDRFYNENKQKLDLFVKADGFEDVDIKLVFRSFTSILAGARDANSYKFKQVPIDEKVTVVAIAKRGEKNYVAFGDYTTSCGTIDNLVFQPVTTEGLKDALKKLDSIGQKK